MTEVSLFIDGISLKIEKGSTILETALANNIYIPHLCYHPDLEPFGGCRVCVVEIEGRGLTISCNTPVEEGMRVITESAEINKVRRIALELLVVNHHADCLSCAKDSECKLQTIASYIGIEEERLKRLRRIERNLPIDDSNPFFLRDPNRCVLCGICVRTCSQIQGVDAIDFAFRGFATIISTFGNEPIAKSICQSCGECVVRCPVGALIQKNRQKPAREAKSICPYCGCGCSIYLGIRGDKIISVRGDIDSPVNRGSLCVKGRFGYEFVNHPQRLTLPLVKKNGEFVNVSWDEALEIVARGFEEHKGDEFFCISSAKCTIEENYIIQKFTRLVMQTNNIDHCARLCHAPSVAALAEAFGSGAMTNSIAEIENTDCILITGSNTTEAHPIIGLKIKQAKRRGAKLIVVDPRRIELAELADVYLPFRSGTDVAWLNGMMNVIINENLMDEKFIQERCEGFDEFKEAILEYTPEKVQEITGIPKDDLIKAAIMYATSDKASIVYSMGITQHTTGTDNVFAIANLAMLTGNIGRESTGVNPLRGQNNVQGACDMGALPLFLPGYQKVVDAQVRAKFEDAWGVKLPDKPGLTFIEMLNEAGKKIKAIYIMGENPMVSNPDLKGVEESLKALDFLVVQDIFLTETAKLADVVLPAVSFAEKDGTFTNTERRVQLVRKAIEPIGEAKPDWKIIVELANKMGYKMEYTSTAAIMEEISKLTPSYGGISHWRLQKEGGLQWPCPNPTHPGTKFLHKDKFVGGKGKFKAVKYSGPAEVPDEEYPFRLTTGRMLYHYHTGSMSRRSKGLDEICKEGYIEINPQDANSLGINDGDTVTVSSRRDKIKIKAKITDIVDKGAVFIPFHFAESAANFLTNPALNPIAKIPELKVCAVRIEK